MSQTASVNDINIAVEGMLYARTFETIWERTLMVYRSPIVRDSDRAYGPVAQWIESAKKLHGVDVVDEMMYFGRGQLTCYRKEVVP